MRKNADNDVIKMQKLPYKSINGNFLIIYNPLETVYNSLPVNVNKMF